MALNGEWHESLCGCFDDCGSCLCGYFCPWCLFGQNAEKIDGSNCCLMGCLYCFTFPWLSWLPHCLKRRDLRRKYGLREDPCADCPTAFCCTQLALCQEARFLKRRAGAGAIIVGAVVPGPMPHTNQPRHNY